MSTPDPKTGELANALADAVEAGTATRRQVLSAMNLAFEAGAIAGSLATCNEWQSSINKIAKAPA